MEIVRISANQEVSRMITVFHMKRLISLVLIGVLMFGVLTGCQPTGQPDGTNPSETAPTETPTDPTEPTGSEPAPSDATEPTGDTEPTTSATETPTTEPIATEPPATQPNTGNGGDPVVNPTLSLRYDDFLDLSKAPYNVTGSTSVTATTKTVTSRQVANGQTDAAVITYDAATKTLYAAGVGTATLTIGNTTYDVTVVPAPISVFLIGGHSVSAGVGGNPEHSVVCPAGQVYSSYESYITDKVNPNWGWAYNWSLSESASVAGIGIGHNAANRPQTIDALTTGNTGTYGSGSGLAYQWNKLTGEKVWMVNAGHGGMGLSEWRQGAMDYVHATKLMKNVLAVLQNEINAGHYTFARMNFFYFSCANGDQTWFNADYVDAFNSMWNGFKQELATNLDSDSQLETFDAIGLVPHWRPAGSATMDQAFNNGQTYNYYMAASKNFPDVFIASSFCRGFTSTDASAIAARYPAAYLNYATQNGKDPATLIPTILRDPDRGNQNDSAVFPDWIHCGQITQNLQGMIMAESLYARVNGTGTTAGITVYKPDGINTIANGETITLTDSAEYRLTVMLNGGVQSNLTFEISGNIRYDGTFITTGSAGTGKLVIKNGSAVIHTVNFNITAGSHHTHCDCAGNYGGHSCQSAIWQPWNSGTSLPTESGYYYLTKNVNITNYAEILNGNKVHLCLNGYTVTRTNTGRIYQTKYATELTVTDCKRTGKVVVKNPNQNGGAIQLLNSSNSKLNWYGGTLSLAADGTSASTNGGLLYITPGSECNIYGGAIVGGKATQNGGNIYNAGTLNIRGGAIVGGSSTNFGGNIYSIGTFTMSGGTVSGGTSTQGGNVCIDEATASFTMSGGSLGGNVTANGTAYSGGRATTTANTTSGWGGNLYIRGTTTITGTAQIVNGWAQSTSGGGNIHIAAKTTGSPPNQVAVYVVRFTMDGSGVVITGGTRGTSNASNDISHNNTNDQFRHVQLINGTLGSKIYLNGQ